MIAPVFIVGSPRSGTSILSRALQGAGYAGFSEGNFLSLLRVLERDVQRHFSVFGSTDPNVMTARIDPQQLVRRLARVFGDVVDGLHGSQPWFDKTGNPEMVQAIPHIRALWPTSRFIFAKRRAIENVVSRLRKFPEYSFEYHCSDWARNMAAWRAVKGAAPDLPGIEIDQQNVIEDAAHAAARLATFLQLSAEARCEMERIISVERPQQSEPGSAARRLSLAAVDWTVAQRAVFERECGEEMRLFGYTTDVSYRTSVDV